MKPKSSQWLPRNNVMFIKNTHFWIITGLMIFVTFLYYVAQTPLVSTFPFNQELFTGVHDVFRIMYIALVVYAAIVFRVRGSLLASIVFLIAILPRALLFSPYADPLLRPLLTVIIAALAGLLIAVKLDQTEKEKKVRTEFSIVNRKLGEYNQRLEENQKRLIQAEQLAALGQLASSIAHEVNNPIAGAIVYTQLLSRKLTNDNISREMALDYLSKINSDLNRSARLVRNLLDFAQQSPPALRPVDLSEVVEKALDVVAHFVELQNIQIVKNLNQSLPKIMADFDQLQQVCINLILNAVQAIAEKGEVTLTTSIDADQVKMEIKDTGRGIPPENMHKLFTPFFTTKQEVKGVGLGLAASYGIVQRHKGRIEVYSKVGEGSIFTVYLPLHYNE